MAASQEVTSVLLNQGLAAETRRDDASLPALTDQDWVRVVFPGITDHQVRFDRPLGGLLSAAVENILSHSALFNAVEVVSFPGRHQQEYLLTGHLSPMGAEMRAHLGNRGPDQALVNNLHDDGVSWETAFVAAAAKEALIPRLGIEIVGLGTGRLGCAPVVTSRLASTTRDTVTLAADTPESPFAKYITRLGNTEPQLSRTLIVATDAHEYAVEQQVAYFGLGSSLLYADDRAAVYTDWDKPDQGDAYAVSALTSNVAAVTDANWGVRGFENDQRPQYATVHTPPDGKSDAWVRAARTVIEDGHEYARLLGRGQPAPTLRDAYDELDLTPTIRLDAESLAGVLGLVPNYDGVDWNPYASFPPRGPPPVTPQTIVREASGTDHSLIDSDRDPLVDGVTADTVGAKLPAAAEPVARTAVRGLRANHSTIHRTADTPSLGLFKRRCPDEERERVLVGTRETLSAGDVLLVLASTAAESGVTVAVDEEATARWVLDIARRPFIEQGDEWTALYSQSGWYWVLEEGRGLAVVPRDCSVQWQTRTDGLLRLCIDGEPVATGEVSSPPTDGDFPVYCVVPEGPGYSVYDDRREYWDTLGTVSDLADEYEPVPLPIHPDRLTYLTKVSVFETSAGVLSRVTPEVPTTTEHTWRVPASYQPFADQYFRRTPSHALDVDSVATQLQLYLHGHGVASVPRSDRVRDSFARSDSLPAVTDPASGDAAGMLQQVAWPFALDDDIPCVPGRPPADHPLNQLARQLTA